MNQLLRYTNNTVHIINHPFRVQSINDFIPRAPMDEYTISIKQARIKLFLNKE